MIHRNVVIIECDHPDCRTSLTNIGYSDNQARHRARANGWHLATTPHPDLPAERDLCPEHAQRLANLAGFTRLQAQAATADTPSRS